MNCDILKIVRGNDFATQMTITALDAGGNVIEDFSLEDSTDVVVKYTLAGESHTIEAYDYDIEGNDITIQWSDLALGKYGFEIEGKFNGYSWRSAARFIFQIVADNASANIPDGVLVDGVYKLNDWLRLLSGTGGGGKQVQADWTETDAEAPSYIQHKPELAPVAISGSYNDLTNKPTIPDVSGKADKVSGVVAGDFAGLDANGNLTDSGKKASDFATAAQGAKADTAIQDISGKQDVLVSGTNIKTINNESILGSGNITIEGGGGAVESVNGKTGVVVLDATDVGAATAAQVQDVADDVATNTQDIATLQAAYEGLTQSDIVVGALPSSGIANTIYRVPSTSSYSDYMWNGSQFVLMATYNNAIDSEPTLGSNNLVSSNGVAKAVLKAVDTKLESFKTPTQVPDASQEIANAPIDLANDFGVSKIITTTKYNTLTTFHVVCAKTSNKPSLLAIPSGNKYVFISFLIRTKGTIGTITASDISYNSGGTFIVGGIASRETSFEAFAGHEDIYKVYVRYTLSSNAQSQDIRLYQDVQMQLTNLTSDYSGFQSFNFRVWWGNESEVIWDWDVPFWHDKLVNTLDVTKLNTNGYVQGSGDLQYMNIAVAPIDIQNIFKVKNVNTINNSVLPTTTTDIKIIPSTSIYASGGGKFTLPSWAKVVYASCYVRTKHTLSNISPNASMHYTTSGTLLSNAIKSTLIRYIPHPMYEDVYMLSVKWFIADDVTDDIIFFPFVTARLSSVDTTYYNGLQSFYFRQWYAATDEYDFEWDNSVELNRSFLTTNPYTQTFKKICLYGTSIEATGYFDSVAAAFGLNAGTTYLNYGNGGGGITWNPDNTDFTDTAVKKAFSCTLAEKEAALTARGISPSSVEQADLNTCYDVSVLQNLDADLYIFGTYGINDRSITGWDSETSEFDRTTIYGAYNYVIDKLLEAKPSAKIIILGQHCFAWSGTNTVNNIQGNVAKHWNIPFLDMGHNLMFNSRTFSLYTSDGCHPNNSGEAVIANFVKDWLISHTNNRTM